MKKLRSAAAIILVMMFLLTACSKTPSSTTDGSKNSLSLEPAGTASAAPDSVDGKTEASNEGAESEANGSGGPDASGDSEENSKDSDDEVEILISPGLAEAFDISDDDINSDHPFTSMVKNDDGSYTIKMTKSKQKELLEELSSSINEALDELVENDSFSFTGVEASDDYTSFKVKMTGDELGFMESFMVMAFYTYGGMYNVFGGKTADNIHVDFINDATGELIDSADSGDVEKYFESLSMFSSIGSDTEGDSYDPGSEEKELDPDSVTVLSEYTLPDGLGWYTRHYYVVRNDSDAAVDISTNTVAYGSDGEAVSSADGYLRALAPGCTALFYEAFETDSEIYKYEPVFNVRTTSYIPVMQDLVIERTDIDGGAVIKVTNNGSVDAEFVELTALFFRDGKLVETDYNYFTNDDSVIPPGQTISGQMDSYEEFDSMEIYISGGLNYGW